MRSWIPTRAAPVYSTNYGAAIGLTDTPYQRLLANSDATQSTADAQTSTDFSVTGEVGFSDSVGLTVNLSSGSAGKDFLAIPLWG